MVLKLRKNIGYVKKTRLRTKAGKNSGIKGNLPITLWFIYPIIYIFIIQSLGFGSLIKGFANTFFNPYTTLITYLLVTGFSFILWLFFENRWISFSILNFLGFIIALGNRFTIPQAETGLAMSNLGVFNELSLLKNAQFITFLPFLGITIIALPLLYFCIFLMHPWKTGLKYRRAVAVVTLLIFAFISQIIVPMISTSRTAISNVEKTGVILFFNNGFFGKGNLKYPDKAEVDKIMKPVKLKDNTPVTKPNIIIVQLTNFVDINRVVKLKVDPLKNYHALATESSKYIVDLSTKQKDNLNVEFEVLAGLPVEFHPNESQVRASNTAKGTISLGGVLSKQGYESIGILPYPKDLREDFYNKLSFDNLISSEDLGAAAPKDVISEVKKTLADSKKNEKPVFIYTHLNVLAKSYEDNNVTKYAADLKLLDEQIASLKKIILDSKEPTILLLYGDNLPNLGVNNKVYYDSGYIKTTNSDMENKQKINSGDMLLWNNYNQAANYPNGQTFDLCNIPYLLLGEGGFDTPNYLQYFQYLKDEKHLSRISADYLEINNVLFANDTKEYKDLSSEFSVIIKDVLGPNKYVEESNNKWSN